MIANWSNCRKCGADLIVTLAGVPKCRACTKRERGEIDALIHPCRSVDYRVTATPQATDGERTV